MKELLLYSALGIAAGFMSGLIGIGGGVIIVPTLVFIFGLSQAEAQGTTLALMVPPIGFLGAWSYYQEGYVNVKIACLICLGFFLGSFFGAKLAINLPSDALEKIFGGAMMLIAIKMIVGK
jgi:uncharacterized membrane protein YfcA